MTTSSASAPNSKRLAGHRWAAVPRRFAQSEWCRSRHRPISSARCAPWLSPMPPGEMERRHEFTKPRRAQPRRSDRCAVVLLPHRPARSGIDQPPARTPAPASYRLRLRQPGDTGSRARHAACIDAPNRPGDHAADRGAMRMTAGGIVLWDEFHTPLTQRRGTDHACRRLWRESLKALTVVAGISVVDEMVHVATRGVLSVLLR